MHIFTILIFMIVLTQFYINSNISNKFFSINFLSVNETGKVRHKMLGLKRFIFFLKGGFIKGDQK